MASIGILYILLISGIYSASYLMTICNYVDRDNIIISIQDGNGHYYTLTYEGCHYNVVFDIGPYNIIAEGSTANPDELINGSGFLWGDDFPGGLKDPEHNNFFIYVTTSGTLSLLHPEHVLDTAVDIYSVNFLENSSTHCNVAVSVFSAPLGYGQWSLSPDNTESMTETFTFTLEEPAWTETILHRHDAVTDGGREFYYIGIGRDVDRYKLVQFTNPEVNTDMQPGDVVRDYVPFEPNSASTISMYISVLFLFFQL